MTTSLLLRFAAAFAVFVVASPAAAGPFGVERGMTLAQLPGKAEKVGPGMYRLSDVPKPHPAFEAYVVIVGPTTGVCWVKGVGKAIQTGAYGTLLQASFHDMKDRLAAIYGTARVTDQLNQGSIWNEPRDWMMGMLKKERRLVALWTTDRNKAFPKAEFKAVALFAHALDGEHGALTVEYSFANEDACLAEIAKVDDSSL